MQKVFKEEKNKILERMVSKLMELYVATADTCNEYCGISLKLFGVFSEIEKANEKNQNLKKIINTMLK